ncbi:MAG: hypothetical protein K9G42_01575 [Pedobacter sp.]|nr:hypothetical protein [Pedobacter sp.]
MLLNIVTDEELLTSQIVKSILLINIALGIMYNLYRLFGKESTKRKMINFALFALLSVTIILVYRVYRIEAALLNNSNYVSGITLGYCSVFALGTGIEFEYEVNGQKFSCCNTFHPISKDSIVAIGGKYSVRFSKKFPERGRMNFKMRIE